ncbi:MAG: hypothetical protein ACYDEV_00440 [Acidiferrobacter sp.]
MREITKQSFTERMFSWLIYGGLLAVTLGLVLNHYKYWGSAFYLCFFAFIVSIFAVFHILDEERKSGRRGLDVYLAVCIPMGTLLVSAVTFMSIIRWHGPGIFGY